MELASTILDDVGAALVAACALPDEAIGAGPRHAARSRNFVGALAERLRASYQADRDVAVLSKHFVGNRERFGLNELLFDILVCQTCEVAAAVSGQRLTVVRRGILAVESEFARDSRQALHDFNKLILSAADSKLFIGPRVADQQAFLVPLAMAAPYCSGQVLTVFVPHPSDWIREERMAPPVGYYWNATHWTELPRATELGAALGR